MKNQIIKKHAVLAGLCTLSGVLGIGLGYFLFGPMGLAAGDAPHYHAAAGLHYSPLAKAGHEHELTKRAAPPYEPSYLVTLGNGYIVVYSINEKAGDTLIDTMPTQVHTLPPEEQARLARGIRIYTEEALIRILEDYGS